MPDPLILIVRISQELEQRLEIRFGATGNGLGEKLGSVEDRLPECVVRKIRRIVGIRNEAVHVNTDVAEKELSKAIQAYEYVSSAISYTEPVLAKLGESVDRLHQIVYDLGGLLIKQFGARGKSFDDKLDSVANFLPENVKNALHNLDKAHSQAMNKNIAVAHRNIKAIIKLDGEIRKILAKIPPVERRRKKKSYKKTGGNLNAPKQNAPKQNAPKQNAPKQNAPKPKNDSESK